MSLLKVSEITDLTGAGSTYMPGHVVNTYFSQATVTQSAVLSSASFVDFTGVSVTLTPKSTQSKFLIQSNLYMINNQSSYNALLAARALRNGLEISRVVTEYTASASGRSLVGIPFAFLDSPNTTSSITYKMQGAHIIGGATPTVFFNRSADNTVISYSSITVMEIAQ
jgi:hypothetical protein